MADVKERLQALIDEHQTEFVLAMFVDLHGKPCAKLIPSQALDVLVGGAGFAGFAAGGLAQSPADPDCIAVPDPRSFTPAPWLPGVAVVMCDLAVEGTLWPYTPRVILQQSLDRLEQERGQVLMAGAEAEYMLVRRNDDGTVSVADELDRSDVPCYGAAGVTRMLPHLGEVSRNLNALGYGNYANDHEDANGQFEQNFTYADALTTADRLIFFRFMVGALAERRGMTATFMPKPFAHLTGNGLHCHLSLWTSDGRPLFEPAEGDDAKGLGLSGLGYEFVGGLLEHARAMAAITCPTVNSYKRLGAGAPVSGATWAPAAVAYGGNNRTHLLRVPDDGRVEYRGVDGSANPYLALTALLAAGLDGVDRHLDPGAPNHDDLLALDPAERARRGIGSLPPTLLHAVDDLVADPVLRAALGTGSRGDYIDYFASVKREEFHSWHATVTPWELTRYVTPG